jgi:mono/diheme cytochrome c family protein
MEKPAERPAAIPPSSRFTFHVSRFAALILFTQSLSLTAETNTPAAGAILFDRDVRPIFEQNCLRCHGPEKPKSGFRLDNRADALKGGSDNRDDVVPGRSDRSKLIAYVAGLDPDMRMPPPDRGEPLTPAQVATLRAWIDQGANWGTNSTPPPLTVSIEPVAGWMEVQGDNKKYHELEGMREGWSGGADHFFFSEQLAPDQTLTVEGRALLPQHDFKVTLSLDKKNFGFVRSGFEEWRRYYDDTGGSYPLFTPSSFSLDKDLHLDLGRAWIDFGLTLPDAPRLVLGYEYQFRQGDKSTLAWGTVNQGVSKNIYPNAEHVDEHTHVFKADLTREWDGWYLEDRVRTEFYHLASQRDDVISYTPGSGPDAMQQVSQEVRYSQGANTFRVEKQIADWWLASLGSLLSVFDGTSSFKQTTTDGTGSPVLGGFWRTEGITLHRESYVFSGSSLFLPLKGLSISAAAQGEWTHQSGFGNVDLDVGLPAMPFYTAYPGTVDANQDRSVASENLNVRYTRLPYTVLFAEGRLQQESIGQSAEAINGTADAFQERTDAINYLYDARAGFTCSPRPWIEWGGHYRFRDSITDYNHPVDTTPGYPAFISHRDITTEEIEGRLVLRPAFWLTARLTWQWFESDFSSTTDPVAGPVSPGGPVLDGSTDVNRAGLNLVLTPNQRFFFSGSFTYSHSRTTTAGDGNSAVAPYRGDIYTLGTGAGYALDARTRLDGTYAFSEAGYGQNNTAGLPLGLDFTRHQLVVGLTRRFNERVSASLRYSFSQYLEPSSGGVNDFTAHGIFATLSYRWP